MSEQAESGMTTLFECVRKCDRVASPVVCDRERYVRKIESGLRSNLLVALQLIIERDPAIPSGTWDRINRATGEIEKVTEGQIVAHAPIWR